MKRILLLVAGLMILLMTGCTDGKKAEEESLEQENIEHDISQLSLLRSYIDTECHEEKVYSTITNNWVKVSSDGTITSDNPALENSLKGLAGGKITLKSKKFTGGGEIKFFISFNDKTYKFDITPVEDVIATVKSN